MKNLTKRAFALILTLTLAVIFSASVFADINDGEIPAERLLGRLTDAAGLLSDSDRDALERLLDETSERLQFDIAVVTVDDFTTSEMRYEGSGGSRGYTVTDFADDVYDYYGFGYGDDRDGCILVLSMADRDWHISTCGYGITALYDSAIDYIGDEMISCGLSDGDYYSAFSRYAELCEMYVEEARNRGDVYNEEDYYYNNDYYNDGSSLYLIILRYKWKSYLLFSLIAGAVIGFIGLAGLKAKMKTVRFRRDADNYIVRDSLNITRSSDRFLYSSVSRTKIVREETSGGSSTHVSSSGTTHGGGGGKF